MKMTRREKKNIISVAGFLLPNFLGFLMFTGGPVLLSLYMSFTNWSLKPSVQLEWIGLRNYTDLFTDPKFWFYLYNTFYFMMGIPLSIIGSLFLANLLVDSMMMRKAGRRIKIGLAILAVGFLTCGFLFASGSKDLAIILMLVYLACSAGVIWGSMAFRTMLYIPSFASGVATIILWTQIFNPYHGMFNGIIEHFYALFGITDAALPMWLTSTKSLLGFLPLPESFNNGGFGLGAREAIMFMGFWMGIGGNNMILYIASISNIPESLYEAAEMDGAGSVGKFIHITVPSVAPTTFFIAIMSVIGGLQGGFDFAKIMTNGGPAGSTTTLAYYIYVAGFEKLQFGYASAVAWVMFVIIFGLTIINWKYGNRKMEM